MKKIAAITMARNDNFFVEKWIDYYSKELGEEHVFVFLDGEDQEMPKNITKANVAIRKHVAQNRARGDKSRINFLSEIAKNLFEKENYDLVIGTDCDEFLAVNPDCKMSLKEYLSQLKIDVSVSGLGIDVGQNLNTEKEVNYSLPILEQRSYAVLSSRYTKPSVIAKPVKWGSGFHRVKGHNFHIDENLFLFHLGYCDQKMLRMKSNGDRLKNGWENHLKRREKTIIDITNAKKIGGEKEISMARKVQTVLRPIFALNKPSMGFWDLVVKIPEKFKESGI